MDTVGEAGPFSEMRTRIRGTFCTDELELLGELQRQADVAALRDPDVRDLALALVDAVRRARQPLSIENLLRQFPLSSPEGALLLGMAEALARIPDRATADALIADKLGQGDWRRNPGEQTRWHHSLARTLAIAQGLVRHDGAPAQAAEAAARRGAFDGVGRRMVGFGIRGAMQFIARRFVMGTTIDEALARSASDLSGTPCWSFDMLGEASLTETAAEACFAAYFGAIAAIARHPARTASPHARHGVSVKLSALHPRFEYAQRARCVPALAARVLALACAARQAGIGLTLDAEESERLDMTLDVFECVYRDPALRDYDGFGLAVQAYQKRAFAVVEWLVALAQREGRGIPVRLVKGAYWDSEIKLAQAQGLPDYPVFTRKAATDLCYLACARRLLDERPAIYPQFATHNALTIAQIGALAGNAGGFEFQRLHGMGEAVFTEWRRRNPAVPCRVYAPVGSHRELLPYLVRRLLENGASTSFVHRAADPSATAESLVEAPAAILARAGPAHPAIARPLDLFGTARRNSRGMSFADPVAVDDLLARLRDPLARKWHAAPLVADTHCSGAAREVVAPSEPGRVVGEVVEADTAAVEAAIAIAHGAATAWEARPVTDRAAILERAADLIEERRAEFLALLAREGGKTLPNGLAEVREAADYCRYYAATARRDFGEAAVLAGIAGERNNLRWRGRGVFAAISPWNFPLAIFIGQTVAALAAGNAVLAKPARQTPLVAHFAVRLLHEAGVPPSVLHFLPGDGAGVGARLVADERVDGVVFTGSTQTARGIQRALAARSGAIVPLIAETGGQNAMIVDSSALPEQVVVDAVQSAFDSAGQRCSALRVVFVQREIADRVCTLIRGAMEQLILGDPTRLETDIGPVIDAAAKAALEAHLVAVRAYGRDICRLDVPAALAEGHYFAPCAVEIDRLDRLQGEVFGPILHLIRYDAARLDDVVDAINGTGYGLTLGIQSRIDATVERICARARVGNVYVNRNTIGATVGAQPFGGRGLSGTGPKAGGPHYLHRFATEQTVTTNTAAAGGNASLMMLDDSPASAA